MKRRLGKHRTGVALAAAALLLVASPPGDRLHRPDPLLAAIDVAWLERSAHSGVPLGLVEHLRRHYRISTDRAYETARAAYLAAGEHGLDPLLVLAVIGVESSFNPAAESGAGAKGLMQIIPRYHLAKLSEHGGEALLHEPLVNIVVGTRILGEYIERRGGVEAGLQFYNGAAADPAARYARKVIAERERLQTVVRRVDMAQFRLGAQR